MDGLGLNEVIVVEDENNPIGGGSNLVDQRGQDGLGRRWLRLRSVKQAQYSFPDVAGRFLPVLNYLQGSDEIGQKARQIVIALAKMASGVSGSITSSSVSNCEAYCSL